MQDLKVRVYHTLAPEVLITPRLISNKCVQQHYLLYLYKLVAMDNKIIPYFIPK